MSVKKNAYKGDTKTTEAKTGYFKGTDFKMPGFNLNLPFDSRKARMAAGIFLLFLSLVFALSFTSYLFTGRADQSIVEGTIFGNWIESGMRTQNWLGLMGAVVSHNFMYNWFGIGSFFLIPFAFSSGVKLVFKKDVFPFWKGMQFIIFGMFWTSLFTGYLAHISDEGSVWAFLCGATGYELAGVFYSILGWGTLFVLVLALVLFLVYFVQYSTLQKMKGTLQEGLEGVKGFEEKSKNVFFRSKSFVSDNFFNKKSPVSQQTEQAGGQENQSFADDKNDAAASENIPSPISFGQEAEKAKTPEVFESRHTLEIVSEIKPVPLNFEDGALQFDLQKDIEEDLENDESDEEEPDAPKKPIPVLALSADDIEDEPQEAHSDDEGFGEYDPTLDLSKYVFPTIDLLNPYDAQKVKVTHSELNDNKNRIEKTLNDFKISIQSIRATIGPTVTLYEIVPEAGIKISKIKNLEDDIALSLSALGIRIIAPIPGRGTIGIEVPNKNREMVSIYSILNSPQFLDCNKDLPIALGKSISNEVFIGDLTKMPHLLMAGATGQGKSVGLNVILTSLIYKKHPSELKFVLVDPKKVELSLFEKIERHFLAKLPGEEDAIITDTKKVVATLQSLCIEMDGRYDLLKMAGCRNIKEYNGKFKKRRLNPENGHKFLPYIVLVIDELADLMMTAGKEVETPIARLAQLARAVGIHLIIATQRPSVNVITGIIKANFPARLSFKVTSKIDSRTILDTGGAEQLIGAGDMLLSNGSELIRLQCAYADTEEVERVCEFIGLQQGYNSAYELPEYVGDNEKSSVDIGERDELFDEAARVIVTHQQGSTSLIQRKLSLGYNRAGRIIDQLEAAGVVGPFEGSKARQVLINDVFSLEQFLSSLR